MVPESSPTTAVGASADGDTTSMLLHAVVGAVVGTVLSFVPLSPVLGGGVAGYLQGGDPDDGLKVGGVAGALMLVPFVLVGLVVTFFLGFGFGRSAVAFGVLAVVALVVGAMYTVGLSVAGGYLGNYLANER